MVGQPTGTLYVTLSSGKVREVQLPLTADLELRLNDPAPKPEPEPEPEPEETEEQRRARLIKKMEDIFAAAEPMENYTFTLNDPVTVEGREYYYGVWQRVITDYDTQSRYLSIVAEFFITPDGDECYIGTHFPANEGNGETVVFSSGNIFEEINNG